MYKMKNWMKSLLIMVVLTLFVTGSCFSDEIRVATGGKGGFYHTGLFKAFNAKVKRYSSNDWECVYAVDKGTDGTLHNIKLVEQGKADVAFIQLGGLITSGASVETIGTIMYELGILVAPKGSKVSDADDLESSNKYSVGINTRGGGMVTFNVFKKYDKDYSNANIIDFQRATKAISAMQNGSLDSFFFVSVPGTKDINRIKNSGLRFLDVDDSDFNDLKFNGKRVYDFVKVGKKNGFPNNFKTIRIPAIVIANSDFISDNEDVFDILFDATSATKNIVQSSKKLTYYPKN